MSEIEIRPSEAVRKFFESEFTITQDDNRLLKFLEQNMIPLVNSFTVKGYTKQAIADGMIKAINIWRNK